MTTDNPTDPQHTINITEIERGDWLVAGPA